MLEILEVRLNERVVRGEIEHFVSAWYQAVRYEREQERNRRQKAIVCPTNRSLTVAALIGGIGAATVRSREKIWSRAS
jgi:hypothetical protein